MGENELLSPLTRKVRNRLLTSNFVGFVLGILGLQINKISILGSEFGVTRNEMIPIVLVVLILYYLITFIVYGLDDFFKLDKEIKGQRYQHSKATAGDKLSEEQQYDPIRADPEAVQAEMEKDYYEKEEKEFISAVGQEQKNLRLRWFWEFYFPLLISAGVIVLLMYIKGNMPLTIDPDTSSNSYHF